MFNSSRLRSLFTASLSVLALGVFGTAITSCVRTAGPVVPAISVPGVALQGMVHGGQQPVKGATVQLYAVGSGGDGSASTTLLSHTVSTDGGGAFNITGLYTCPSASSLVYITSLGGDPGLGSNNPNIAEMAALGPCGSLNANTYIVINEVSTVAAVYELSPYMSAFNSIGYGNDLAGITAAFTTIGELVNLSSGTSPGKNLPAGTGVPTEQIYALADVLAACVNSTGGTAGDGSTCGKLFTYTGVSSSSNTIAAMLQIARNPGVNVSQLYSLISPNAPFQPILTGAPTTWNISPVPVAATPTIYPGAATYNSVQTVSLSDTTPNTNIYYTTDGTIPTLASTVYTGPFSLSTTTTIKAIDAGAGYATSAVATSTLTINIVQSSGPGTITTVAGNGAATPNSDAGTFSGDGGPAINAGLSYVTGVVSDSKGNFYIADLVNNRIRKVDTSGNITTYAGGGTGGDNGAATSASLQHPYGLAVDANDNLYIAEANAGKIRKVIPTGIISTVAGNGGCGSGGDGGQAISAGLCAPVGVALDPSGNIYIAEQGNHAIRKINTSGIISTFAGGLGSGYNGDGIPANTAWLYNPSGVAADSLGNVYIADQSNKRVRMVSPSGTISTVAGTGGCGSGASGITATTSDICVPVAVAVDNQRNLYISDPYSERIRKVTTDGNITTVAGIGNGAFGSSGDGGPATSATLGSPQGLSVDATGNLFIADSSNYKIRKVTFSTSPGTTDTPTFSPAPGTYNFGTAIYLQTGTAGATIYYTLDGTTPTTSSPTYTGPFFQGTTATVNAIAVKAGLSDSSVASATYTITNSNPPPTPPNFDPQGGTYSTPQYVHLMTASLASPIIYYTTDGSDPGSNSLQYDGNYILVSSTETIRAIAIDQNGSSTISSATYTISSGSGSGGIISTYAGNGASGYSGDGGLATSAAFSQPLTIAVDGAGNTYVGDANFTIRKITPAGVISTYAGINGFGVPAATGDGGPATSASFSYPDGMVCDAAGNLYFADPYNNRIRKISTTGIITTYAGTGTSGYSGDGGLATNATLAHPESVALDAAGNLYITDTSNQVVRKVTTDGKIATIAGGGSTLGDGGQATSAQLIDPFGIAVDSTGNLFIGEPFNYRIRKVTPAGIISTYAGSSTRGFSGDGGPATSANINNVYQLAVDSTGNLYIPDMLNSSVRVVSASTGIISTVAGTGVSGFTGDGGPANAAELVWPRAVAFDTAGNFYIADSNGYRIRKVTAGGSSSTGSPAAAPTFSPAGGTYATTQTVTLTSTTPNAAIYYTTDGGLPTSASQLYTGPLTVDSSEPIQAIAIATGYSNSPVSTAVYGIGQPAINTFPVFSPAGGTYSTTQTVTITTNNGAGSIYYTTDGSNPTPASNFYTGPITVSTTQQIRAIAIFSGIGADAIYTQNYIIGTPTQLIRTIAGQGPTLAGYAGDNGPAAQSLTNFPTGVGAGSAGVVYIADTQNNVIRRVVAGGNITTVAGNGNAAYSGDGGQATSASLDSPSGVAVDSIGNLYIADAGNNVIRKVDTTGIITTYAGNGTTDYSGDGGQATVAGLSNPTGVAITDHEVLYIADYYNNVVRKVTPDGIITTVAGTGTGDYSGDGGPATSANLQLPGGVAVDPTGNLYIADTANSVVRIVTPTGTINTYAGTGQDPTNLGDGGQALGAFLGYPTGVAVDASGNLYIADAGLSMIRKVGTNSIISTITGTGQAGFSGDNNLASQAQLNQPGGVAIDSLGDLFIADTSNNRIREVYTGTAPTTPTAAAPTFNLPAGTYVGVQNVNISSTTPGAIIYYTTDGTTPTSGSNASVTQANYLELVTTGPLKAIAVAPGYQDSPVTTVNYTITTNAPTFLPAGGTYPAQQVVSVASITPPNNGAVFCTTDGSDPAIYGTSCSGNSILVLKSQTIRAIAYPTGFYSYPSLWQYAQYETGTEASATYVISPVTGPGIISTIAGYGTSGWGGEGTAAIGAQLNLPRGVAADTSGNIYIADTANSLIRKIDTSGNITTIAGVRGYSTTFSGDGGPATSAQLQNPVGISFDHLGNLFIADTANNRIRKIDTSGVITTVAGNGAAQFSGDGSYATSAALNAPTSVAVDTTGNLYIADTGNNRIRKVTPDGFISTIAGGGTGGDGGAGTNASLSSPMGVFLRGSLYIAEAGANRIRLLDSAGNIHTFAGNGTAAYTGDGGLATSASLSYPESITVASDGTVYIADTHNSAIRMIGPGGIISTVAGTGFAMFGGDGGPATNAFLSYPNAVALDATGNIYIADTNNYRVRKVQTPNAVTGAPVFSIPGGTYTSYEYVGITSATPGAVIYYTTDGTTPTTSSERYQALVGIYSTKTLQAIAVAPGLANSAVQSATYTLNLPTAAAPIINPGSETSTTPVTVFFSSSTPNSYIYYTTDGSDPTNGGTLLYGALTISSTTTVRAYARADGYNPSPVSTAVYTINLPVATAPTFTPAGGTYTFAQSVTLASPTYGGTIYYTTDGSTPNAFSTPYTAPITVSSNETIKAYTTAPNFVDSPTVSAAYTITVPSGSGIITTLAGVLAGGNIVVNGATANQLGLSPSGIVLDGKGNFYVSSGTQVLLVNPAGIATIVAGTGTRAYTGDGGLAVNASLGGAWSLALDKAGNLYIADYVYNVIRRVATDGTISTYAGNGTLGYSGDGGPAKSAQLAYPMGIAIDATGNLFIAEFQNNCIRKVATDGTISTYAGSATRGYSGDGGQATSALLAFPQSVAFDHAGNLLVADTYNYVIRSITPAGIISTIAGNGVAATQYAQGDGGSATAASLTLPTGLAVDAAGTIYFCDGRLVRIITSAGGIFTYAGNNNSTDQTDNIPALTASLSTPNNLALDSAGNLYIADQGGYYVYTPGGRVRVVTPGGTWDTVLAPSIYPGAGVVNGPQNITFASLTPGVSFYYTTDGSAPTGSSNLYDRGTGVAVTATSAIKVIATKNGFRDSPVTESDFTFVASVPYFGLPLGTYPSKQLVSLYTGSSGGSIYYTTDGSTPTTSSTLYTAPFWVTSTETIQIFAAIPGYLNSAVSSGTYTITNTASNSVTNTIAGNGTTGFTGDGGAATAAELNTPVGVAVDPSGNVYIADNGNNRVRKVTPAGKISTYAGNGSSSPINDGSAATGAGLFGIGDLTFYNGSLYIVDGSHNRIRKVNSSGIISTIAGTGTSGYTGDGGQATSATLSNPASIAFDSAGNLYIADSGNNRVRKVTTAGVISTYAGGGTKTNSTSNGLAATSASFSPVRVRTDGNGNLYVVDLAARCVHMIDTTGIITTFAGTCGSAAIVSGEGGPATSATMYSPFAIAVDTGNNVYIADDFGYRVYRVSNGTISTVVGNGQPGGLIEGIPGTSATVRPVGVTVDSAGSIYVVDQSNEAVRKVTYQ